MNRPTDKDREKDEDDKFFEWMDRDKLNYNSKHPKKRHKRKKKSVFIMIGVASIISVLLLAYSNDDFVFEKYSYLPDYRLNKSPVFCAQEFVDPMISNASKVLVSKTGISVKDWQNSIRQYTGSTDWNFEYKVIPVGRSNQFSNLGCDATITFERLPPVGMEVVRGETAYSHYGFSDVVIFYLDSKTGDRIDQNIDFVIKHELGHVLGLGHPQFNDGPTKMTKQGDKHIARSIMVTPEIYPDLPENVSYNITDYDVRAVVNLYGGGISNTPIFFGYTNYIIIGIVLFGIAFYVNKKLKE